MLSLSIPHVLPVDGFAVFCIVFRNMMLLPKCLCAFLPKRLLHSNDPESGEGGLQPEIWSNLVARLHCLSLSLRPTCKPLHQPFTPPHLVPLFFFFFFFFVAAAGCGCCSVEELSSVSLFPTPFSQTPSSLLLTFAQSVVFFPSSLKSGRQTSLEDAVNCN